MILSIQALDGNKGIATRETAEQKIESFGMLVWKRFRKHRLALVSAIVILFLCLLSLLAPIIEAGLGVSHDMASLQIINLSPAWPHLLGTNELGQDVFTRLIYGGRISLAVGIISALTSAMIGAFIGLLAGFHGGMIDSVLMRFTDAMLSVPVLPLMIVFSALELGILFGGGGYIANGLISSLAIAALVSCFRFASASRAQDKTSMSFLRIIVDGLIVGLVCFMGYLLVFKFIDWHAIGSGNFGSVIKLILIIVFFGWMTVARLARASTIQLKQMEFVTAAKALGSSSKRILLIHILPNALAPIIVAATLEVGGNILYEAALSFLGLGIQPPVSSWGNMLNNAVEYIKVSPGLAFWPGFFILVTVSCFNFFGDGLRDALDPHQVMKSAKE